MQRYLDKIQVTLHRFKEWNLVHIPREQNSKADTLANLGSSVKEDDLLLGAVVQLSKSAIEKVYGAEALIPVEVGEPSARFRHTTKSSNNKAMTAVLEL
uniref:Uncharacterized protein LOC104227186 n=1 Tax=Nicotiana sylvestris TaxID=4096 RepID=A0A1U7WSM5_NICSY|nr:PREDICTED: uncharacterized protein LOC104227186 [Nicotiana sylvestris]